LLCFYSALNLIKRLELSNYFKRKNWFWWVFI